MKPTSAWNNDVVDDDDDGWLAGRGKNGTSCSSSGGKGTLVQHFTALVWHPSFPLEYMLVVLDIPSFRFVFSSLGSNIALCAFEDHVTDKNEKQQGFYHHNTESRFEMHVSCTTSRGFSVMVIRSLLLCLCTDEHASKQIVAITTAIGCNVKICLDCSDYLSTLDLNKRIFLKEVKAHQYQKGN